MGTAAASLSGRCALVTGASRGIGRAIALALAGAGAGLVVTARGRDGAADGLAALEAEIRSRGGEALALRADVSREEEVATLVGRARERFGPIDVLVNNAAVFPSYHATLVELPLQAWDETIAVNLRGPFLCLRAVLPGMMARRSGSIINVSSMAAVRSGTGRIAYGVSKAGLERLTFGLAAEVQAFNIAVNALSPVGVTDTASARAAFPGEDPARWVRPEDLAEAAVWLARQDASSFTGKAVMVPASGSRTVFVYGQGSAERSWVRVD